MPASGACSHMTTQHIGAALSDVSNQFLLFKAQQTMLLVLIGKAIEHFCHSRHELLLPSIQRTEGFGQGDFTDMQIDHRRLDGTVAQQVLQCFQIDAFFQRM